MKDAEQILYRDLCSLRKKGVRLLLEGRECDPGRIVRACQTAEYGAYMRDYIPDRNGKIVAVGFDCVVKRPPAEMETYRDGMRQEGFPSYPRMPERRYPPGGERRFPQTQERRYQPAAERRYSQMPERRYSQTPERRYPPAAERRFPPAADNRFPFVAEKGLPQPRGSGGESGRKTGGADKNDQNHRRRGRSTGWENG